MTLHTCIFSASGGSHTFLNETQTMFPQLLNLASRFVHRTDHAHYVKRRNKNLVGTVSHYYTLVVCKFMDFKLPFRQSVWFSFSVKQFPFAVQHIAVYS